jgi:quinol monooxygenase YgiN
MIIEYIRYTIAEDQRDLFEGSYGRARDALAASPHCLAYELARCTEDPAQYILRIEWDSLEGHMEGFRRSPEFRTFFAAVRPFVSDIAEMRHYERTAVHGRAGRPAGDRGEVAAAD